MPITARTAATHVQYVLPPLRAFSSMFLTSYNIIDARMGAEFRLSPDGEVVVKNLTDIGTRIVNVSERQSAVGNLDAGRHDAFCEPLITKGAFSTKPFVLVGHS